MATTILIQIQCLTESVIQPLRKSAMSSALR